jgi:hypothetical protein
MFNMARPKTPAADQAAKLTRLQIDAYYLGLTLKELGRKDDFVMSRAADLAGDFLLGWARLAEALILEREPPRSPLGGRDAPEGKS